MEANRRARRRIDQLASHVRPSHCSQFQPWLRDRAQLTAIACRAGVSEAFPRRDNRTLFARQASDGHGQFMRQVQEKQIANVRDKDDDTHLRPASALRPESIGKDQSPYTGRNRREAPENSLGPSFAAVEPLFARPVRQAEPIDKHVVQNRNHMPALSQQTGSSGHVRNSLEEPGSTCQSSPHAQSVAKVLPAGHDQMSSDCFGFEWFPRMDVVESGLAYVITVELPGVSADGIHVEVVRGSLFVTGNRATDWWKANNEADNGGGTVYHRRELAQGPYKAVWRLPKNGDIYGMTAEFIDGFLRVLLPKIKMMTYM